METSKLVRVLMAVDSLLSRQALAGEEWDMDRVVEAVEKLNEHPGVRRWAVISIRDGRWGSTVHPHVLEAVRHFCPDEAMLVECRIGGDVLCARIDGKWMRCDQRMPAEAFVAAFLAHTSLDAEAVAGVDYEDDDPVDADIALRACVWAKAQVVAADAWARWETNVVFSTLCKQVFDAYPGLHSFGWKQYIPAGEDGDSCLLRVIAESPDVNGVSGDAVAPAGLTCSVPAWPAPQLNHVCVTRLSRESVVDC